MSHHNRHSDAAGTSVDGSCVRRGLSLVEVVVSTFLVGLVMVGALKSVGGVVKTRIAATRAHDGTLLAQDLMNEILSQEFVEPTQSPIFFGYENNPEGSQSRLNYDDVDDYNGWTRSPPRTKDNTALTEYTGWTRSASISFVQRNAPNTVSGTDEGLKRIIVTVTDPNGRQTQLTAWRSQWGALEQAPAADTTVQTRVESQIQAGSGTTQYSGTALQNHARDQ